MILRLGRTLRLLLAMVLWLQSSLAMAHCVRVAAGASGHASFRVEICTADGLVVMEMAETGDADGNAGQEHVGFCLACHGLPQAALPEPAGMAEPWRAPSAAIFVAQRQALPYGARAPPYAPRGPPHLS